MPFQIKKYRAGWKPNTNEGQIRLQNPQGQTKTLNLSDPAEFAAVLTILATSDAAGISDAGVLWSGPEDIDG